MLHLSWIVCRLWNDRHGFVCEADTAISQITVSSSVGCRRYIARQEECLGFAKRGGGRSDLARNIPVGRLGHPDEVAQAVLMVLGNDYMTGQTIVLNGGLAFI